ncbi:integral membrane sensor signal transduction histidine kinase [[Leptolyngbya] sp. PCC 7376]|uniref:ATP-binding protein n=1 Tax=[Leptolyngbya] sp. PCC 7376 TaxID=111781 RepID=UPI00029EF43F|nr:HAMP domain-containing sensor histidine kinase [[Leptolyngbya] sp. PCC 7376]AFY36835.1 integral membrane sensor signal transduction histidine kinase [[Leptolyngbya] sp. PCC 7376]
MKFPSTQKWLSFGFGAIAILLGLNGIVLHQKIVGRQETLETSVAIWENYGYLNFSMTIVALAEVSQQNYLATGNPEALATSSEQLNILQEIRTELLAEKEAIEAITSEEFPDDLEAEEEFFETQEYQESLDALDNALVIYIQRLQQGIEQYDSNSLDVTIQLQLAQQLNEAQLEIQEALLNFVELELIDLEMAESDTRVQINNDLWLMWLMLGLSLVALGILYGWLLRTSNQGDRHAAELSKNNKLLSEKLEIAMRELKQSQSSLQTESDLRQTLEATCQEIEEAKELTDLKLNFFSLASHELRTPLSAILVSAQLLDNPNAKWTEEKRSRNLRRIQSSAKTMTQLLADILLLTRAEAGKLEFNPQVIELKPFCQKLVEEVKFNSQAQHDIEVIQQGECDHAYLDEILLRAMLMSLLTNAIKYSPQESQILFTIKGEVECANFQIKDQGIGIPFTDQKNLFEMFRRGTNTKGITGTGLGLAVVKKCLDIHGGAIDVQSQVGVGTTFSIEIPWSAQTENHEKRPQF